MGSDMNDRTTNGKRDWRMGLMATAVAFGALAGVQPAAAVR